MQREIRSTESLRIESSCRGCFHGDSATIAIELDGNSASLLITRTTGRGTAVVADRIPIPLSRARHLIDHFLNLLETRQRLAGDYSTTIYEGSVVWTIGTTKNEWRTHSSEVPIETVKELLASELPEQTKQQIEQSRVNYFNLAHELHKATMAAVEEHQAFTGAAGA